MWALTLYDCGFKFFRHNYWSFIIVITVQTSHLSIVYINITDHKLANKFLIVRALITSVFVMCSIVSLPLGFINVCSSGCACELEIITYV